MVVVEIMVVKVQLKQFRIYNRRVKQRNKKIPCVIIKKTYHVSLVKTIQLDINNLQYVNYVLRTAGSRIYLETIDLGLCSQYFAKK